MDKENTEKNQVAFIRHEINNALTTILGQAQLILLKSEIDEATRQKVLQICEMSHKINGLMDDWRNSQT